MPRIEYGNGNWLQYEIGDALELIKDIPDESIDFILTDPPYGINKKGIAHDDSLKMYYNIMPELYRIIKNDKWLVTFAPIGRLPDMFKINHFKYSWAGVIYYSNQSRIVHCPCGTSQISLYLMFKKGNAKRNKFITDTQIYIYKNEPIINHPAPKPDGPLKYLIKCCSKENDIVFDPFFGSGTTGKACRETNRNCIGFEIEKKYEPIIRKRILADYKSIEEYTE
jgi:DNA modification methylase